MSPRPDNSPSVRRVILPSGKTIEVVYFREDGGSAPDRAAVGTATDRELHVCPDCSSRLVYPVGWQEAGEHAWELHLRCPNCEWIESGVFPQSVVERLDEELDNGTQELLGELKELVRSNMEAETDRFAAALQADLIWPMDF